MLDRLLQVGVDVFRLNFSHGSQNTHGEVLKALRRIEQQRSEPITVIADLQGPKIRCGQVKDGALKLAFQAEYALVNSDSSNDASTIPVPHPEFLNALEPGDVVLLDDGKLRLTAVESKAGVVTARCDVPGTLKNRKGMNLPSRILPVSALTEKDRSDLDYALEAGVDYIALSFVQQPSDVQEVKALIDGRAGLISKIEKPSAIERIDEIVNLSDGVMVARGDLGVEMPPEQVPVLQRRIVRKCRAMGKPVIVATHMLESMIDEPTPTRAEASDVATAVFQGADAVMLSAESAVGQHPLSAVAIMDRILQASESGDVDDAKPTGADLVFELTTSDAIARAAHMISEAPDVTTIVAYTKTGSTAWRISRERPDCNLVVITPSDVVARRLQLGWGLTPVLSEDVSDFESMVATAEQAARDHTSAQEGDRAVIVTGYPFGRPGKTNALKISRL